MQYLACCPISTYAILLSKIKQGETPLKYHIEIQTEKCFDINLLQYLTLRKVEPSADHRLVSEFDPIAN